MKRHPRRSDEEWLNIIHECRTSGLPDKTWCEEHHIHTSKFYYHIRRLRAKACEITEREATLPQKQEVVPVSFAEQEFCIPPTQTAGGEGIHPDTVITIRMNGIQLDISHRAARETIANTVSVLRALC